MRGIELLGASSALRFRGEISNGNMNDYITNDKKGIYYFVSCSNAPSSYFLCICLFEVDYTQIGVDILSGNLYVRTKHSGGWKEK